ncbi:MFS transporter [Fructobacillus evanidus]|uniref:MFS family (AraJ) n=1 Tax=Fructobacillus evanidus TaxID=3064281 RepID=A0ABM9MNS8_9LACO|nr:MFS family (AraJ) [Fructobacillus sp. LMG 32999]CAK1225262.1 MFS family (AraJ) [Fructobacillus sp. LMG 32999]CAK1228943.1 MFS family (AraJ) [Fructobacillus sp. LMG 32999]CAK1229141.1 MFS family (AraJ) [Fructobacillus sp. LMG 32999]CAK1229261.1 MFS family (AraJ) [Fructobacillus sp. LMG 32999]
MKNKITEGNSLLQQSNRQIQKATTSDFFGHLVSSTLTFVISLSILKNTGSALSYGTSLIFGPVATAICAPIIGKLVDYIPHKKLMLASQIILMVWLGTASTLLATHTFPTFPVFITTLIIINLHLNLLDITLSSSATAMVVEEQIPKLNSLEQISISASNIIGPSLAGLMFSFIKISTIFSFSIIIEGIVLLLMTTLDFALISNNQNFANSSSTKQLPSKSSFFNWLKNQKIVLNIIILGGILNFFLALLTVGLPYLLLHHLHASSSQIGLNESISGVGFIIGSVLSSRIKINDQEIPIKKLGIYMGAIAVPLLVITMALSFNNHFLPSYLSILVAEVIIYILIIIINIISRIFLQTQVNKQYQGRTFSALTIVTNVMNPVGLFVFGAVFQYSSFAIPLLSSTLAFILMGVYITRLKEN